MGITKFNSWDVTKTSFKVIREDESLLLFPVMSSLAFIGILILFSFFSYEILINKIVINGTSASGAIILIWIPAYFLFWLVGTYFSASLMGAAMLKLNGKQATVLDGIKLANSKITKILLWAIVAATVGIIIRLVTYVLSNKIGGAFGAFIGDVVGISLETVWAISSYFIIPVILFEDMSIWDSLDRSESLFMENFGTTFISNLIMAAIGAIGVISSIIIGIYGFYLLYFKNIIFYGFLLMGIGMILGSIVLIIVTTADTVLVAALYRYATTQKITDGFLPPQLLNDPLIHKGPYIGSNQ
ncbi:MAG: DUF6159 family protein [Thermoplasmata archaeon]